MKFLVSNPNGVNLHHIRFDFEELGRKVSNPNGVNLHALITSSLIGAPLVSNPNGVNLHANQHKPNHYRKKSFKPQRGKFTQKAKPKFIRVQLSFKPQRGKFTRNKTRPFHRHIQVSNPNGVNLHL